MVTASHNDNGWTGVKMGAQRPVTFGPDEMGRLRDIVLGGAYRTADGGRYRYVEDFRKTYLDDLAGDALAQAPDQGRRRLRQRHGGRLRAGTAGACRLRGRADGYRSRLHLSEIQSEPRRPRNAARDRREGPRDRRGCRSRLRRRRRPLRRRRQQRRGDFRRQDRRDARARSVRAASGRRPSWSTSNRRACSRPIPSCSAGARRRTTGRPAIPTSSAASPISRRSAGFEKSGHFFFNAPVGRGYDDGLLTGLQVLAMLDRNPGKTMADLYADLPKTWGSPTMSPHCDDEKKYGVVDAVTKHFQALKDAGRNADRLADPRRRDGQRRARDGGGRHLGPGARVVEQAGACGGRRKPGVGERGCAKCSRPSTACCAHTRKSAPITRRSEARETAQIQSVRPDVIDAVIGPAPALRLR